MPSGAKYELGRAAILRDAPPDAHLLESFVATRDEAAFEAIVWRHGPMVMGVCLRILGNLHDAEDVFQATFLVLARKASCVSPPGMVGNWLYGVAYQTALKARAMAQKRRAREGQNVDTVELAAAERDEVLWRDLRPIIDEELNRLPPKYRAPLVLCDIEDKSYKQAAEQLGWPEGTVSGRLSRARALLAERLSRRGVVMPTAALGAMVTRHAATAAVPPAMVTSTVKAASQFAAGQAATAIPASVATLTEGVLRAMMISKLKTATAVLFAACLTVAGLGWAVLPSPAAGEEQKVAPPALAPAPAPAQPKKDEPKKEDPKQVDPKKVDPKVVPPNNNGGNQNNQNDDGQKNQNDDGQKNQNDDGQKNQNGNGNAKDKDKQGILRAGPGNAGFGVLAGQVKVRGGVLQADVVKPKGNNNGNGQNGQNDDGQKNQKDDGQKHQKNGNGNGPKNP